MLFFCDVEAGTVIHFTDNAWMDDEQQFRATEGVLTFTAAGAISAGTVVSCPSKDGGNGFVESGSFNPAGSGDNLIVYQGSSDDPFFIFGIGWARGASVWEYSTVSASYRSDVPMGLSFEDGTVVGLGTSDGYGVSVIPLFSDSVIREEMFELLSDGSNYDRSNSDEFLWSDGDFLIKHDVVNTFDQATRYSELVVNSNLQLDHSITVHSITIQPGATLEILPGGSLTVIGQLINLAGADALIIKADESGSGALYSSSEGVNGTVEVYLTPDQWHFVSSPVTGTQTISEVFGTIGDHLYGVYNYDEPTAQWISTNPNNRITESLNNGFNAFYQTNAKTLTFTGTLNNFRNRRFFTVSRGAGGGWNLIGNPFPAPMCWSQYMIQENLEHETIYVTTGGSGGATQWDTFNGMSGIGVPANDVGNVAVGQAFWVRGGDGGGSVGVGCYAKTYGESRFKGGLAEKRGDFDGSLNLERGKLFDGVVLTEERCKLNPVLNRVQDDRYYSGCWGASVVRLGLFDGEIADQVAVCFDRRADVGFDGMDSEKYGWDGIRITNNERRMTSSGIAIPIEDKHCIIAAFPFSENEQIIPLSIYNTQNSTPSLQLLSGSELGYTSIILEDRLLGIMHDLSNQPVYEFHAGGGFLFGRFFLRVGFESGGVDEVCGVEENGEWRMESGEWRMEK
ncbi:MAG: hypothetical protein U9Q77_07610, partial [Candidatus Marinimicrobia bacterium]|nr:hypothetical protein [Candidatus Neomarinimicrobiota bacterium]